uniref:Uncharacterized protein n=1 Tax=Strombidinopsis acuminata TaxID=141414 RepID=A0A7S3WY65_9SPIT|mmetsp:Transcript_67882/g.93991  ORF Transcript_67882/g.93991 Transcript_67882/m.93991 type:complete len:146 (+) Transcript_67882:76-513(+)
MSTAGAASSTATAKGDAKASKFDAGPPAGTKPSKFDAAPPPGAKPSRFGAGPPAGATQSGGAEVDPLDAFMMGMSGELKEDQQLTGTGMKRKYVDPSSSTGVETSKDTNFDSRERDWSKTKGFEQHQLRKAYNKKLNAMRGPSTD